MGRAKLLLPLGTTTVIARLLSVLRHPGIAATVVVLRKNDEPLRAAVDACGAIPLQPAVDPPDMRQSVVEGIAEIERRFSPVDDEGWLLAPADHPLLDPQTIEELVVCWQAENCQILVPSYQGRRGHPTLFRWSLAREIGNLPAGVGLNRLLYDRAEQIRDLPVATPTVLADLDTPEDYERLLRTFGHLPGESS